MSLDRTLNLGAAAKPEARISEKCFLPRGSTPHLYRRFKKKPMAPIWFKMLRWKSFASGPPESFAGFRLERGDDGKDSAGPDFGHLEER